MNPTTSQSVVIAACATAAIVAVVRYSSLFLNENHNELQQHKQKNTSTATTDEEEEESQSNRCEQNKKSIPNEIDLFNNNKNQDNDKSSFLRRIQTANTITISYASTTGTCESFAKSLLQALQSMFVATGNSSNTSSSGIKLQICKVNELDWWDELLNNDNDDDTNTTITDTHHASLSTISTNALNLLNNNNISYYSSNGCNIPPMVIFILPTWTNGTLPEQYSSLLTSLDEICHDWRVAPRPLRHEMNNNATNDNHNVNNLDKRQRKKILDTKTLQIASFGMGSTAYDKSTFCKPAKDVFKYFIKLGAKSLLVSHGKGVVGTGDDDAGDCKKSFQEWKMRVVNRVGEIMIQGQTTNTSNNTNNNDDDNNKISSSSSTTKDRDDTKDCCQKNNPKKKVSSCACQEEKVSSDDQECCQSNKNKNNDDDNDFVENEEYSDEDYSDDESDYGEEKEEPDVMDLEDIGNAMQATNNASTTKRKVVKEMVTPKQAIALKKEGYKIIGTHSAVKLCRWTKHQLRGRGGCYKHTFYGITSYQCMEATPSLACANKCVFCWRHHKNPVGREWRWKIDDPHEIVDKAVKEHVAMIKEAKGIPGVKKERWEEAHTVRHCALSLVGEPIMYPRIDEFLADLHERSISTFLVTNGQHPTAIASLRPITQLYVSVDASTPETLEAIDRPLFKDAWDRLKTSLKSLKNKGQRTVARLTVVKGWNSDEIEGYAKLIALGHCSLVEVKGVTFCGKSDASNLNMTNTPWHHEVVALTQNLQKELAKLRAAARDTENKIPEYGLACEHKHSCSVLLARVDQFAVDDPVTGKRKWRTWIDYDKFHQLAARHAEDPTFKFGVEDYVEDTPSWAVFGAEEEGFDPTDTRHRRKQKYPKYTKFDENGVPTHDDSGNPLDETERKKLVDMMIEKKKELGDGVSVLDLKGGEKIIDDASLMFRGLTITK